MGSLDNLLLRFDEGVTGLFAQWNLWTSVIVTVLVGFLTYHIATREDPDTHPMLLARQALGSNVRQSGESPIYRSQAAPHGMPLNAGLNVKNPGAPKWSRGRDGDLGDIWRQAVAGVEGVRGDGQKTTVKGRIVTVYGANKAVEHTHDSISRLINLIGHSLLGDADNRVAIYLPNSVELIMTLFACAFYQVDVAILPFDQPDDVVISMLRRSGAKTVVTALGSFPFDAVVKNCPSVDELIWTLDEGNRHMNWNEPPLGTGSRISVTCFRDLTRNHAPDAYTELPFARDIPQPHPSNVTMFWQSKPGQEEEMVTYTTANLISAIAAQLFAVPTAQRMGPSDMFLPADSLSNAHTLVLTLTALFSNASVAFNSVAAEADDLAIVAGSINPTVVVATPAVLRKIHERGTAKVNSSIATRMQHRSRVRQLAQKGVMPTSSTAPCRPTGDKLRLVYTAARTGQDNPHLLTSAVLTELRALLGARILYALTAPKVASPVTQTAFYDYRVFGEGLAGDGCHFGPPVTSTEVLFRDIGVWKSDDKGSRGEIVVRGPSVIGGEAALGAAGMMRRDNTLTLI